MRLKKELKLRLLGSDYMIVDTQSDEVDMAGVYTLNPVAARIWEMASEGEFELAGLVERVCEEYDVERARAEEDVAELISCWKEYGLVDE